MSTTPIDTARSTVGGIHRGIWIGGGLMALTIIALATTLVVKSNGSGAENTGATAATPATETVANAGATPSTASVAEAPATPAPTTASHHAGTHHESEGRNNGNSGNAGASRDEPQRVASVPVCATCGVIEGYSPVQVQGQTNGIGAVAGGVGGALVGSKIAGRGNHTLGGVIGAVGGGLLGNAIEKHERTSTVYDVRVRMNDGSMRTVRQSTVPNVGTRVNVDGNTLRAAPDTQG